MSLERRSGGVRAAKTSSKAANKQRRLSCEAWSATVKFEEIHGGSPGEPVGKIKRREMTLYGHFFGGDHRQRNAVLLVYTYMRLNGILDIDEAAEQLITDIKQQDWSKYGGRKVEVQIKKGKRDGKRNVKTNKLLELYEGHRAQGKSPETSATATVRDYCQRHRIRRSEPIKTSLKYAVKRYLDEEFE